MCPACKPRGVTLLLWSPWQGLSQSILSSLGTANFRKDVHQLETFWRKATGTIKGLRKTSTSEESFEQTGIVHHKREMHQETDAPWKHEAGDQ